MLMKSVLGISLFKKGKNLDFSHVYIHTYRFACIFSDNLFDSLGATLKVGDTLSSSCSLGMSPLPSDNFVVLIGDRTLRPYFTSFGMSYPKQVLVFFLV